MKHARPAELCVELYVALSIGADDDDDHVEAVADHNYQCVPNDAL